MKYEVIRAWHGVEVGDVIETDKLHDALKAHVRQIASVEQAKKAEPESEPAPTEQKQTRRGRPPKDKE